ncbi:hypothetical protein ABZ368_08120 [Streptomyces sp. NPDC005908]|uniref:hypothetical protein n=1 Tax=unclassified Streptomyces TaxID=2593676 RepID=UPI0011A41AF8|nr:hypothetical protein [Streptomyces sp. T12]TWD18112.1 hypothetical protein FB570_110228 [Streptomyces sp. T12]
MNAPTNDRAGARPVLRTGSRVLFLVLVCLLAAVPAAGLALASGAVTQTRNGALPRPDVLGLLCRQGAPDGAAAAGRDASADRAGAAEEPTPPARSPRSARPPRPVPAVCGLPVALPAAQRATLAGTPLSCRAG